MLKFLSKNNYWKHRETEQLSNYFINKSKDLKKIKIIHKLNSNFHYSMIMIWKKNKLFNILFLFDLDETKFFQSQN